MDRSGIVCPIQNISHTRYGHSFTARRRLVTGSGGWARSQFVLIWWRVEATDLEAHGQLSSRWPFSWLKTRTQSSTSLEPPVGSQGTENVSAQQAAYAQQKAGHFSNAEFQILDLFRETLSILVFSPSLSSTMVPFRAFTLVNDSFVTCGQVPGRYITPRTIFEAVQLCHET